MFNKPTNKQLAGILKLYETEHIPLKDKLVYLHFYIGNSDWYVMEFDGDDTFWGFAILNNDYEMAEFGYFSFHELADIMVKGFFEIENDASWEVPEQFREMLPDNAVFVQAMAVKAQPINDLRIPF